MGDEKGFKRFSGEGDDSGKALKRWRQWCLAKMATVKDLNAKQRGPWVYTLLDGAAWEAVEHLTLEDLSAEDGEKRLWKILGGRFPEKEAHDLMGEALGEVFGLAARDQESMKSPTLMVASRMSRPSWRITMSSQNVEIDEDEAAEALAVTWKERRQQINQHHRARRFNSSAQSSRSFRIEVEELKKRTRCRKCNKVGHWARECPMKNTSSASTTGRGEADASSHVAGAAVVEIEETFVGACENVELKVPEEVMDNEVLASGLISSPGYGIIDSGCGKTLIGMDTLKEMIPLLEARCPEAVTFQPEKNTFRFGNGAVEHSEQTVKLRVGIAGELGSIRAAVIQGQAPLLLGRPTLEKLNLQLDFANKKVFLLNKKDPVPMVCNSAGQLLLGLTDFPPFVKVSPQDTMSAPSVSTFCDVGSSLSKRECRCLLAQVKHASQGIESNYLVAELFSPPRFTLEAEKRGDKGLAFDLSNGFDLLNPKTQKTVDSILEEAKPSLLVVCPTCTHEGGWENYNRLFRSPLETARLIHQSRQKVKFCVNQIHKQIKRGGDFVFEHPWGSRVWKSKETDNLRRKFGVFRVDMCAYNLTCPDTKLPIQKATGLMASRKEVASHMLRCPGCEKHRSVEGKLKDGTSVSTFVAQYTPEFVKGVLDSFAKAGMRTEEEFQQVNLCELDVECLAADEHVVAAEESPEVAPPVNEKIRSALVKLHKNLGHPSQADMLRVLKHSGASDEAIRAAHNLECSVCAQHKQPASALPAKVTRRLEFNEIVSLDVKYLPGWKTNQRVPCVNIVDHGTSMQVMAPIFTRETGELLKGVFRDSWLTWAGPPVHLITDPSKPNLSQELQQFCENHGINMSHIAADAHWQLGKTERHGHWFEQILERIMDEVRPQSAEEFVDCVTQAQVAKNSLISVSGASPYQLIFGKNPRVPQDLLQEEPHLVASEAVMIDSVFERSQRIRSAARKAVLEAQDDRALRQALRARPRPHREFQSGDWVYYWRSQKWVEGTLIRGGRWHGAALILGKIGRNFVVAHRRSILRCAPEQLRPASSEERATFPESELLGIRTLLEKGQFPKSQFVDITQDSCPPEPDSVVSALQEGTTARALTAAEVLDRDRSAEVVPAPLDEETGPREPPKENRGDNHDSDQVRVEPESSSSVVYGPYGPVRHRHRVKSPPEPILIRHPEGQFPKSQFVDITQDSCPPEPDSVVSALQEGTTARALTAAEVLDRDRSAEVVPAPLDEETGPREPPKENRGDNHDSDQVRVEPESSSSVVYGPYGPVRHRHRVKSPPEPILIRHPEGHFDDFAEMMQEVVPRLLNNTLVEPSPDVPIEDSTSPRGTSSKREASSEHTEAESTQRRRTDEVLSCSEVNTIEVLMAAFLQKKAQNELAPRGNDPKLQGLIDEAKTTEWETLQGKNAVRVWSGAQAAEIKRKHASRFIGSRFVITEKDDEDGYRIKGRWCLQGHSDPDFEDKLSSGILHSPTLSQLARSLILQIIVSKQWTLCLGDIKGAFLEAGPLAKQFRPLYAKQPNGGIPGLDSSDVIEVTGNVYGSNDAPFNWYSTLDQAAIELGWCRSQFDSCLYYLRDSTGELCGVMGSHVDDTITGGNGTTYDEAIRRLKTRFPYRKWRVGSGEFCGVQYMQDPHSKEIRYHQKEYAQHLRPIYLTKERSKDREALATEKEISALRAINGAANWLASQSRPDLASQTSFSQQCFPKPKVKDLLFANQLVHRARQYSHVEIVVKYLPWDDLGICFHSDAGFANASNNSTQAGYILSFVSGDLNENNPSAWSPFCWKSYKLPRVVSSTLAAESQSFSTASAISEWMALMIVEARQQAFDLRSAAQVKQQGFIHSTPEVPHKMTEVTGITDCKSLFDHLTSMSAASKCEDKRVAIDLAVLRQCIARTGLKVRWCPTELMLADGLTKDKADPADLLRAALKIGEYQLNPEATILDLKRQHRSERLRRRLSQEKYEQQCRAKKEEEAS
eukprot:symbB.v1.2.004023.t1/scaffold227.1/size261201/9